MEPSLEPSEETFALEEELTFEEDDETLEELEETKDEELSLTGDRAAVGEERQEQTVPLPGTEEMKEMFKAIAEEKISEMVNSFDGNEFYTAFTDRKSTRLNSSHTDISRMPSSA